METHSSRWYFFAGPFLWLLIALAGLYYTGSGLFRGLPQLPWLHSLALGPLTPGASSASGTALFFAGLFLSLAVLTLIWAYELIPGIGWGAERGTGFFYRFFGRLGAAIFFLLLIFGTYSAASAAFHALPKVPLISGLFATLRIPDARATPLVAGPLFGLFLSLVIATLFWILYRWVEWTQDTYVVTDDRLIKQHRDWTPLGWTYVSREMLVRQIRDVDVHQDRVLWKLLRIGTLEIHSLSEPETIRMNKEIPYLNPRKPRVLPEGRMEPGGGSVDMYPGVEWWFCIPRPVLVQREIQQVNTTIERGPRAVDS